MSEKNGQDDQGDHQEIESKQMEQMALDLRVAGVKLYIDYSEKPRRYTGEKFARERPEEAKLAIKWMVAGVPVERIERFLNVDHRTLEAHYLNNIKEVERQKEVVRSESFTWLMKAGRRGEVLIDECDDLKSVFVAHGIARDTWERVSGVPAMKIEISGHVDIDAKIEHLIKTATEEMKAAKARLVGEASDTDALQIENGEAAA